MGQEFFISEGVVLVCLVVLDCDEAQVLRRYRSTRRLMRLHDGVPETGSRQKDVDVCTVLGPRGSGDKLCGVTQRLLPDSQIRILRQRIGFVLPSIHG
jgi:hypothetical protein